MSIDKIGYCFSILGAFVLQRYTFSNKLQFPYTFYKGVLLATNFSFLILYRDIFICTHKHKHVCICTRTQVSAWRDAFISLRPCNTLLHCVYIGADTHTSMCAWAYIYQRPTSRNVHETQLLWNLKFVSRKPKGNLTFLNAWYVTNIVKYFIFHLLYIVLHVVII